VWHCKADSAKAIWMNELQRLQEWGCVQEADPRLMKIMIQGLKVQPISPPGSLRPRGE